MPAACHLLDKMPKNVSGKIDRKALIQLAGETPGPQREGRTFVAPRNDAEEVVCAVLAEVLGLPEVSVTDSFFELGGHSLLLMQVLHQLQDAFEVQIPLRRLYADPTPEGIAALIESLIIEQISAEEEP